MLDFQFFLSLSHLHICLFAHSVSNLMFFFFFFGNHDKLLSIAFEQTLVEVNFFLVSDAQLFFQLFFIVFLLPQHCFINFWFPR